MNNQLNIQIKFAVIVALAFAGLFFISCSGPKRAALGKQMITAKAMRETENKKLGGIDDLKSVKIEEEKIDSAINNNIKIKLETYKKELDSFSNAINFIDSVIKTGKLFRENKKNIKQQLVLIKNYSNNSHIRLRRFEMIDEGLLIAEQHLFYLAAFFGPGKYEIPPDKLSQAENSFSPILDSLTRFYNKYNDVNRIATLRVIGFADGSGFNKESEIYKTLTDLLKDSLASKEAVNGKLSQLRAKNIANVMDHILSTKIPEYKDVHDLNFLFLEEGKGENFPSKKITDYTENDERRRVVLLYWSILPK